MSDGKVWEHIETLEKRISELEARVKKLEYIPHEYGPCPETWEGSDAFKMPEPPR